jgi:hypothetical protein
LLDPQVEYVTRELLDEFALHPVPIDAQAIDKGVDSGSRFVIQRIHELARGHPPVRQLDILNREFTVHAILDYRIIAIEGQDRFAGRGGNLGLPLISRDPRVAHSMSCREFACERSARVLGGVEFSGAAPFTIFVKGAGLDFPGRPATSDN